MTFEELTLVNKQIKTTTVKGNEYAEVAERVQAFRKLFPNGRIGSEVVEPLTDLSKGIVTIKAQAWDAEGRILGEGMAQEKEGSSKVNQTSYVENAETSAVGRALGFIGIGSTSYIASAEEVKNAIGNQQEIGEQIRELKSKITPLWKRTRGDDHSSAVKLAQKYKAMRSVEEFGNLYEELKQEAEYA